MECQSLSYRTGTPDYDTHLEEFSKCHGDIVDDEHCVSSADRWLVEEEHTAFRGHAASMRPVS